MLKELKKIVPTNYKQPLYLNVAVEATKNNIYFYAYNADLQTTATLKYDNMHGLQESKFLVNYKDLLNAMGAASKLTIKDNNLIVETKEGTSTLPINTKDYDEFIEKFEISTEEPIYVLSITNELKQLAKFMRNEPSRYIMNTILFDGTNFVATNTKGLGIIPSSTPYKTSIEICLNPILAKFEGKLSIYSDRSVIVSDKLYIYAKNINGTFPQYKKAIPVTTDSFTVNRKEFIKALKGVMPFTNAITKSIKLTVKDNKLSLNASMPTKGEKTTTIESTPATFEANYNPKYLLEGLEMFDNNTIEIFYVDTKRPLLINQENKTYLVMPVLPKGRF